MEQIRRLIYNERGIAIVVATVESNYFIVSINCSPARHAFRMLIINERDNASQPSPLACTLSLPIPSLSSLITGYRYQHPPNVSSRSTLNFPATIHFNHRECLVEHLQRLIYPNIVLVNTSLSIGYKNFKKDFVESIQKMFLNRVNYPL